MWVFTKEGFLSIVQDKNDPDTLVVRSRFAGHIKALFPSAKVLKTPQVDYLYRAFLPRRLVAERLAAAVGEIGYPNFKNAIADNRYHDACVDVWEAIYRYQRQ